MAQIFHRSFNVVAKVTIFVTNMGNVGEIVKLRPKYFSPPYQPYPG